MFTFFEHDESSILHVLNNERENGTMITNKKVYNKNEAARLQMFLQSGLNPRSFSRNVPCNQDDVSSSNVISLSMQRSA